MTYNRSQWHRVFYKFSGEAMAGPEDQWDAGKIARFADEVVEVQDMGTQVVIMVGGGNIVRGQQLKRDHNFDPVLADQMGMLGTMINTGWLTQFIGMAMKARGLDPSVFLRQVAAFEAHDFGEPYRVRKVRHHLDEGRVVLVAGGQGIPGQSTDTAGANLARDLECEALLKGTSVDGVYSADPKKDPSAERYDEISYDDVYRQGLEVMDLTAITTCKNSKLPVVVFDIHQPRSIVEVLTDEVGTLVHP